MSLWTELHSSKFKLSKLALITKTSVSQILSIYLRIFYHETTATKTCFSPNFHVNESPASLQFMFDGSLQCEWSTFILCKSIVAVWGLTQHLYGFGSPNSSINAYIADVNSWLRLNLQKRSMRIPCYHCSLTVKMHVVTKIGGAPQTTFSSNPSLQAPFHYCPSVQVFFCLDPLQR